MRRSSSIAALAMLIAVVTGSVGAAATSSAAATASTHHRRTAIRPYVRGTATMPTYSYAKAIHQTVYVRAPFDSDGNGVNDRIAVDIIRPAGAAREHLKIPVIMDASPYFRCCGRGNDSQAKAYQANGTIGRLPLFYDNYFVPRGYAVAGVDLVGTARSNGCGDVGGRYEVAGAKAAIDWFNGRLRGFDQSGRRVTANWSSGRVGMIGTSWDGSIANGVAATGVAGLKTIVPISAISSWYDYTRFGGVLRSPGYVKFLADAVTAHPRACEAVINAEQRRSDDQTGNFNTFWRQRDYRRDASRVRASVFVVHGLNDQNVTTNQFGTWWKRLAANGVRRKIWLSQDGHVDPFNYRRGVWVATLHHWFDHWLQGLHNGIMRMPQASIQRADGRWVTQSSWPAAGTRRVAVPLSTLGGSALRSFHDDPQLSEGAAVATPQTKVEGREVFESGTLTRPLRVAGAPSVRLRIRVNRPTTELSARLVDYGWQHRVDYESAGEGVHPLTTQSCWGQSSAIDNACYYNTAQNYISSNVDIITRGWLDAAHHLTLSRRTPLVPGRWYSITVPIDTTDAVFAAGHRVALVLTQSDEGYTSPRPTGATVTIDPVHSSLNLPVTGAYSVPASSHHASAVRVPAQTPLPLRRAAGRTHLIVPLG